jgi:hypothetical protein
MQQPGEQKRMGCMLMWMGYRRCHQEAVCRASQGIVECFIGQVIEIKSTSSFEPAVNIVILGPICP